MLITYSWFFRFCWWSFFKVSWWRMDKSKGKPSPSRTWSSSKFCGWSFC